MFDNEKRTPKHQQIHQRVKEARTIEAIKENYMGIKGKIGSIVTMLGSPIISTGGSLRNENYLDDFWELDEENIPTFDVDESIYVIGYNFDGLSRGMHFEINYNANLKLLRAFYKGFEVYKEVGGELEIFNPIDEWKSYVESLYKLTKKVRRQNKKVEMEELEKMAEAHKRSFFKEMQDKWGLE